MTDPRQITAFIDEQATPVTLAELNMAEPRPQARPYAAVAIALVATAVVVIGLWRLGHLTDPSETNEHPQPDVDTVHVPPDTGDADDGVGADWAPVSPPLDDWRLTSFFTGTYGSDEPIVLFAELAPDGGRYERTLRIWTAPTSEFSRPPFDDETEGLLENGETVYWSDLGGTNARRQIDDDLSLVAQGRGLDREAVTLAVERADLVGDTIVVDATGLPEGLQPLDGAAGAGVELQSTLVRGADTMTVVERRGPGATLDWRRCCGERRWDPSDELSTPALLAEATAVTRQITDTSYVEISSASLDEEALRTIARSLQRPTSEDWVQQLAEIVVPGGTNNRPVDPGPLSPRSNPLVATVGRSVVVWGGVSGQGAAPDQPMTDGAVYDVEHGTWRTMAPHPRPPKLGSVAVVDNRVVVFGGIVDGRATTTAAVYDPAADSWQPIPGVEVDGAIDGAAVLSDSLLVRAQHGHEHRFLVLEPNATTWVELPPPPAIVLDTMFGDSVRVSSDGRWLLYSGRVPLSQTDRPTQRVFLLDLTDGENAAWQEIDAGPITDVVGAHSVWVDDRILFVWAAAALGSPTEFEHAWLDPGTGTWSQPVPTGLDIVCASPGAPVFDDGYVTMPCVRGTVDGVTLEVDSGSWSVAAELGTPDLSTQLDELRRQAAGPNAFLGGAGIPNLLFVQQN